MLPPKDKTFYFLSEEFIDVSKLAEEVIHAAQDLTYPNGTRGLPEPNIEFEAKFLVEINNLYKGMCCDRALLFPGFDVKELEDQLKGWIAEGVVDLNEYYGWIDIWCQIEDTQCYGESSLINRNLSPVLLQKFITENSTCLY